MKICFYKGLPVAGATALQSDRSKVITANHLKNQRKLYSTDPLVFRRDSVFVSAE